MRWERWKSKFTHLASRTVYVLKLRLRRHGWAAYRFGRFGDSVCFYCCHQCHYRSSRPASTTISRWGWKRRASRGCSQALLSRASSNSR